jgi:hypothetical protein
MNLPLQNWLSTQKISTEATSSFEESFTCFKAGTYKASLLFAYLGFLNVIRDRIVAAPPPTGITANYWATIQANAKNPETWDKTVFDTTQQRNPAPIFVVSDDVRDQVKYWKDRRNDCAHSKQNKIIAAYVESLYAFIESNLGKFAVNGSRNEMMRRVLDYFNPSLTSPSESLAPIIHDLLNALTVTEYPAFIGDVIDELEKAQNRSPIPIGMGNPDVMKFLDACFQDGTDDLRVACKTSLLSNDDMLMQFLRQYPEKVYILLNEHQKIRLIWHDRLFSSPFKKDIPLFCSMLRASLIPQNEIPETMARAVRAGLHNRPVEVDLQTLIQFGLYTELEKGITEQGFLSQFDWANNNQGLIGKYLSDNQISREIAYALYHAFNGEHFAWHLADYLNQFFVQQPEKKQEYLAHLGGEPIIGIPSALQALSNQ